jgi:hypothetical protein
MPCSVIRPSTPTTIRPVSRMVARRVVETLKGRIVAETESVPPGA